MDIEDRESGYEAPKEILEPIIDLTKQEFEDNEYKPIHYEKILEVPEVSNQFYHVEEKIEVRIRDIIRIKPMYMPHIKKSYEYWASQWAD